MSPTRERGRRGGPVPAELTSPHRDRAIDVDALSHVVLPNDSALRHGFYSLWVRTTWPKSGEWREVKRKVSERLQLS
jgi:hypothetical protein